MSSRREFLGAAAALTTKAMIKPAMAIETAGRLSNGLEGLLVYSIEERDHFTFRIFPEEVLATADTLDIPGIVTGMVGFTRGNPMMFTEYQEFRETFPLRRDPGIPIITLGSQTIPVDRWLQPEYWIGGIDKNDTRSRTYRLSPDSPGGIDALIGYMAERDVVRIKGKTLEGNPRIAYVYENAFVETHPTEFNRPGLFYFPDDLRVTAGNSSLIVRQGGYEDMKIHDFPVRYYGKDYNDMVERVGQAKVDAVVDGLWNVWNMARGGVSGLVLIDFDYENAFNYFGLGLFYPEFLQKQDSSALRHIAEHESLHEVVNTKGLRTPELKQLFAKYQGRDRYDDSAGFTEKWVDAKDVLTENAKRAFLYFIPESNYFNLGKGGHTDLVYEEFITSFLHTLMYPDLFRDRLAEHTPEEQREIVSCYKETIGAIRQTQNPTFVGRFYSTGIEKLCNRFERVL
ncbi:MAG: hypothetical protein ABH879_02805 [archaeon]